MRTRINRYGMPLILADERNANVHVAVLAMIVAFRVLPMKHYTVLQPSGMADFHLRDFEEVCEDPIQDIDQTNAAIDDENVCRGRMESSA